MKIYNLHRYLLILSYLNTIILSVSGQSEGYTKTINWLQSNNITINNPTPPSGFQKFLDCDSNIVYKKLSGDTITIFTMTEVLFRNLNYLTLIQKKSYFNKTIFPQKVQKDGSLVVGHLTPKVLLYRKDSLFLLDDEERRTFQLHEWLTNQEKNYSKMADTLQTNLFEVAEMEAFKFTEAQDLLNLEGSNELWKGSHPPYFKLIFHRDMFRDSNHFTMKRMPDTIDGKVFFKKEVISLLKQWKQEGVSYYLFKFADEQIKTLFVPANEFLFTSDGKFPDLENCRINKKGLLASVTLYADSLQQSIADSVYNSRKKLALVKGAAKVNSGDSFESLAKVAVYHKLGLIKKNGAEVVPVKYQYISSLHEGLIAVTTEGRCGFIDVNGKEVIPLKYDRAADFSEGLAAISLKKHWGYINKTGKQVTAIKYDEWSAFNNGVAIVKVNDYYGLINKEGNEIVPAKYDRVFGGFIEGFSIVQKNGKYSFINKSGQELISFKYDGIDNFSEGLAIVQVKGTNGARLGFIDKTGNEVIPLKFNDARSFHNGLAIVAENGFYGIIDKTGKVVIPLMYDNIDYFGDNFFSVAKAGRTVLIDIEGNQLSQNNYNNIYQLKDGFAIVEKAIPGMGRKRGLIDKQGKEIIPPVYDQVGGSFNEGLMAVEKDRKHGFCDQQGKEVIPLTYDNSFLFDQGLVAVQWHNKWGFIDKQANTRIPFKFDEVKNFSEGLAAVRIDKKWGFVNSLGVEVVPVTYELSQDFYQGLAAVKLDNKWGFIDAQGKQVAPCLYDYVYDFNLKEK